jgi:solute carrier family 25 carnitine/acylcarnitine transporter 20/29
MNEYIKGGIVGGTTIFIGYPLDTIKTCIQNNKHPSDKINNLYKGLKYPLGFSIMFNSTLFSLHDFFEKNHNINNHYISGYLAGAISAPLLNVIELYKVNLQLRHKFNYKNPFLGCFGTVMRESVASSFYFGAYFSMRDNYHPAIAGGTAGALSWAVSYPIDTIKTRVQSGRCKSYMGALKQRNLWNGLSYCLGRAVIVNSIGFYIYESL